MYDAILSRTIGQVSPETVEKAHRIPTPQPRALLIQPESSVTVLFFVPQTA
jgi:hypothetical protein